MLKFYPCFSPDLIPYRFLPRMPSAILIADQYRHHVQSHFAASHFCYYCAVYPKNKPPATSLPDATVPTPFVSEGNLNVRPRCRLPTLRDAAAIVPSRGELLDQSKNPKMYEPGLANDPHNTNARSTVS